MEPTLGFSQMHLRHFPGWNEHPVLTTPPWAFPVDLHGHFVHLCKLLTSTWTPGQKFHSVTTDSEKSHFFTPVLIMPFPNQWWLQFGKQAGECTELPRAEQRDQ